MKTIVITGATSGIGLECARLMAQKGYRILGVGRSEERCQKAKDEILSQNKQANITFFTADLMQQRNVLRVADEITADVRKHSGGALHALINNAGCVRSWYMTTDEGYEQQLALNYLATFLLTHQLLPLLQNAGGRVILTGSGSHKYTKVRWNDIMLRRRYNALFAYKQSKLLGMLFAKGMNDRLSETGIRAYVADPGLVNTDIGNKGTGGLVDLVWKLRKNSGVSPAVPAKTFAYLCDPEHEPGGLYYYQCREKRYSRRVTGADAQRLLALSETLCGVEFGKETGK